MNGDGFATGVMSTPIIGVAIGMIFTYLIASLIVSSINEIIAGAFQWRGTYLRKAIAVLLSTTPNTSFGWTGIMDWLAAHFTRLVPASPTPSVPAAAPAAAAQQKLLAVLNHPLLNGTPSGLPSYVPARDFSTAVLDLLRDGSANSVFSQVEQTINALPDGDVKRILTSFVMDAAGDLDKLRARIETWFDDAMDRLSGIYKRNSQCFLLALGLIAAIALNVDSVHLATALWSQPDARAKIVAQVQTELARNDPKNPPNVTVAMQGLDSLPLPIGRSGEASFFGEPATSKSGWHGWNWWTVLGWLITAVAISLGAPFWFGLLQNIMNLRNAGPVPARDGSSSSSQGNAA